MTRVLTLLVTVLVPALMLAVPAVGRAGEPASGQCRPRAVEKESKDLDNRMRQEGFLVSDEDEKAVDELRSKIKKEIASLGNHRWAGYYFSGSGLDNNYLYLAPRAGFLYIHRGDIGPAFACHGSIQQKDGGLILSFSRPVKRSAVWPWLLKRMTPIAWGERTYMVPAEELIGFCNRVNDGDEPRDDVYGLCLLRRGDEKKKVRGFPAVPREVRPYLLAKPIEASIIGVEKPIVDTKRGLTKIVIGVTLDRGKNSGLLPGMTLSILGHRSVFDEITVTKVDEDRSEATMMRFEFPRPCGEDQPAVESTPNVGWKLSTRPGWRTKADATEQKTSADK